MGDGSGVSFDSGTAREDMMHQATDVIKAHGDAYFAESMMQFKERLEAVNEANRVLADASEPARAEQYDVLVRDILDATQQYYSYIGSLPEDVRELLLRMLTLASGGEEVSLGQLGNSLGIDIKEFSHTAGKNSLLSVQSIRPKSYIMQVDTITNQLATLGEKTSLRVGGKGSAPIRTTVTLDIPDHMKLEGGAALSTYDKSVLNGVTSMIESGNTMFSIPMLYHAMTGKQNPTVDDALYDELVTKLEKMRRMMLSIDLTEENAAHYLTDENGEQLKVEDLKLEGYLLPLNKVSGMVNGKKAELYQIIQHPPLYTYSKMKRQLATVNISLLDAPINNNATTIPLKTYLLQRIELMKNKNNSMTSTKILYETVYRELGALEANKTRKARIRTYTTTILGHFVAKNYIKGYAEFKQGRSIAGVSIDL